MENNKRVPISAILQYYNILGIELDSKSFFKISTDVDQIPNLQSEYLEGFPRITKYLSRDLLLILTKVYGSSSMSEEEQLKYMEALNGILNTVTALNLIGQKSEDYELHFRRLTTVLAYSVKEIEKMTSEQVLLFWQCILNSKPQDLYNTFNKKAFYLTNFAYLAMTEKEDIPDQLMFCQYRCTKISRDRLNELVLKNYHNNMKYHANIESFSRVPYSRCREKQKSQSK